MTHSTKSNHKPKPEPIAWSFEAIGTRWTIELFTPPSTNTFRELKTHIVQRIEQFDANYSRFRSDSLVSAMAKTPGTYQLPKDAKPMLDTYQQLYDITDGVVTPLIGQTLSDAGYDAEYSLKPGELQRPPAWNEVIEYKFPVLALKQPALLDFGALGKGYLVDIVANLIESSGVGAFCVNAGGDMRYEGGSYLPIALEHPADPTQAIGIVNLGTGKSLCGSSGNRRAWGEYHHIINPKTLRSPDHLQAVWVVADTTMLADGLATALFFADAKTLQAQYTFEYAIVHKDFTLEHSPGFPATFFTDDTTSEQGDR